MKACINCGSENSTPFCPNCGQKLTIQRLSFKKVFQDFMSTWIGFDNRFGRTFVDMAIRPGVVINSYLKGNRMRYIGPLAFLLVMTAILILSFDLFGLEVEDFLQKNQSVFSDLANQNYSPRQIALQEKVTHFMAQYFRFLSAIMIPFWAISLGFFYRKPGLNYVERAVVVIYMSCQVIWLTVLMLGVFAFTEELYNVSVTALSMFYYAFVLHRVFDQRHYLVSLFKTLGSFIIAFLIMMLFAVFFSVVIGITLALTKPELFQ